MKKIEKGIVISNVKAAEDLHFIEIQLPEISKIIKPGNFVSFLPLSKSSAFLRRPFSAAGAYNKIVKFIIKKTGKATGSFIALNKGDFIEVMGPLGNRYPEFEKNKKIWMLGGGTGIASLLYLDLSRKNPHDRLLWGGKTKSEIPDKYSLPANCMIATDDGSYGEEGTAGAVAERWLRDEKPDIIAACGPKGLLKEVKILSKKYNIPAWISTEEFMACGVGACSGCAVPLEKGGFKKACSDGPIFRADEVIL